MMRLWPDGAPASLWRASRNAMSCNRLVPTGPSSAQDCRREIAVGERAYPAQPLPPGEGRSVAAADRAPARLAGRCPEAFRCMNERLRSAPSNCSSR